MLLFHVGKHSNSHLQMLYKVGILKNFALFTRKHLFWSFFNKVAELKACIFIKKGLQHRCFPVNFVKCLRTASSMFIEYLLFIILFQHFM